MEDSCKNSGDRVFPLLLKVNDRVENIGNPLFYSDLIFDEKKKNLDFFAFNPNVEIPEKRKIENISVKDKLSLNSFYSIELALEFLKNDLDDLNDHLKKENFKYQNVELIEGQFMLSDERFAVDIVNLSPGEQLILLLLIWQFMYNKYQVFAKTVLLFDEPDGHLHPKAVYEFLKIFKKLICMGIQIIMTILYNHIKIYFIQVPLQNYF